MKRIFAIIALLLCLSIIFYACGNNVSVNNAPENGATVSDTSENSVSSGGSVISSNSPAIRKIVFHSSINDPQAEYMNKLGGNESAGTARLELTLYETTPDVYEGCGTLTRTLVLPDNSSKIKQEYVYRTGMIRAEDGREEGLTLICGMTEDKDSDTFMGEDAPIRMVSHKDATLLQKDIPFVLNIDGGKATVSIKLHDQANLIFAGQLIEGDNKPSVNETPLRENIIYINCMDGSGDCAAILSAECNADENSFSGRLIVSGNGNAIESINEKIKFTLEQYDPSLYQSSGGLLRDRFTQMGLLHSASGDFILLLDGKQAILEYVDKGMFFCGGLFPDSQKDYLNNEAEKTIEMLTYLFSKKGGASIDYSRFEGLDPNDPEDMEKLMKMSEELGDAIGSENGIPAWYPDGLIPKVNYSEADGYLTTPSVEKQIFKLYNTQYFENEDFEDLVSPYHEALSGYDNYKEYLDYDNAEGVFLFTMGRYSLQVFLQQSSLKLTSIDVYIY